MRRLVRNIRIKGMVRKLRSTSEELMWRKRMDGELSQMFKAARDRRNTEQMEEPANPSHILRIQLRSLKRRKKILDRSLETYSKNRELLEGKVPQGVMSEEDMRKIRSPIDGLEERTQRLYDKLKKDGK